MKKWTKQLFMAAVAASALTACSDANFSEVDASVTPPANGMVKNSVVLTDANGQSLQSVSADFGTYYLNIQTDGIWYIETPNNMEFTPTKMYGKGSARVPVLIGNNWADARQLSYKVNFLNEGIAMRRAGEQNNQTVSQESSTNIEGFKQLVNSNLFVGFGYNPDKNVTPELCTGIQIFKMPLNDANVTSSLTPQSKEDYYYAHSEEVLDKVVSVNGHPGGNFGSVKMSLDLNDVSVTRKENFESTVIQKSLNRSIYCREIAWADMLADSENTFTTGFKNIKARFVQQLAAAGSDATKKEAAAKDLFMQVGTHFVVKAFFGSELNYRMSVSSSKTKKATDVKAALDFKWQQQVKDTAKVDSAALDSLKKLIPESQRKNFVFHGGVLVSDSTFSSASSTKASVKARGGDVEKVSILATGGSLNCADLASWLLGTAPEKATMTEFVVQPIYVLFTGSGESDAFDYLKTQIDGKYNFNPPATENGFGKLQ